MVALWFKASLSLPSTHALSAIILFMSFPYHLAFPSSLSNNCPCSLHSCKGHCRNLLSRLRPRAPFSSLILEHFLASILLPYTFFSTLNHAPQSSTIPWNIPGTGLCVLGRLYDLVKGTSWISEPNTYMSSNFITFSVVTFHTPSFFFITKP